MAQLDAAGSPLSAEAGDSIRAQFAYEILRELAATWGATTTYGALADEIERRSGVIDNQRRQWWISRVLERTSQLAADREEPPLTALCLNAKGRIGEGYLHAPKYAPPSASADADWLAAEHRVLCYRRFADQASAPVRFRPVLPGTVQLEERADSWLDELVAVGHLTTHESVPFKRHIDVARLFGIRYKGHQQATITLNQGTVLWFPKMYENADWNNTLEDHGRLIRMRPEPGGLYSAEEKDPSARRNVITFGHVEEFGEKFYRFLGVFERIDIESTDDEWLYRLKSDTVYFDGRGAVDGRAVIRRGTPDDQAAEALPVDDALVERFKTQIAEGDYSAPEVPGLAPVRGSAQRAFAERVKSNYGWACAVTGIATREFLVASHIVPWSEDESIRKDPTNGVCLSTFVDRAFDTGFIWIDEDFTVRVRWDKVGDDLLLKLELRKIDEVVLARPDRDPPDPAKLRRRVALGY